jgi:hypothetical protein
MSPKDSLESAIQKELGRVYLCTLDELSALLPKFSFSQISSTVERLAQEGAIACRSSDPSRTILWLPPTRPGKRSLDDLIAATPLLSDDSRPDHEARTEATSSTSHL